MKKAIFLISIIASISCTNPVSESVATNKDTLVHSNTTHVIANTNDTSIKASNAVTTTKEDENKVPDFTALDINDKPITLSNFYKSKKVVLIDFWASWCKPCRMENPNVVAAYNKFKDKGFDVFAVSLDATKAAWQKAIAQDNLTYTHVSDLKYWDCEFAKMYGVQSIPSNFLIDNTGKLIGQDLRGEDLEKKLMEVLK